MERSGIACAGNWILDIVHDIPVWPGKSDLVLINAEHSGLGGGSANVAGDLKALGVNYPVIPIGVIGDDTYGNDVVSACTRLGLPQKHIQVLAGTPTAHTHVMNVPGDSRTFFYQPGANNLFSPDHIDIGAIAAEGCKLFYLGYINLLPGMDHIEDDGKTRAAKVLHAAREAGMVTCVDLVSASSDHYREIVFGTLPAVDILFLNEVEAARATGRDALDPANAEALIEAAFELAAGGVNRAVVLHTTEFAIWLEDGSAKTFEVPKVPPEKVVSPVGAGDAFAAGVLHGLHEEMSADDCVRLGFAVAASSLAGATATDGIPKLEELGDFLPERQGGIGL